MALRSPLPAARRHPSLTFGAAGGGFALLFVVATSVPGRVGGGSVPSTTDALLVAGGFVGGALLARLLWARLGGARSPLRGAVVGALIGLLAMPVPVYVLELAAVVGTGIPPDLRPGVTSWSRVGEYVFLLLVAPLLLGAVGLVITYGGTVFVGAVTGFLLARRRV